MYAYRAGDAATGRVEHEYDHMLLGRAGEDVSLRRDPAEVAAVRWVVPAELRAELAARPGVYAPWLSGVAAHPPGSACWAATAPRAGIMNVPFQPPDSPR